MTSHRTPDIQRLLATLRGDASHDPLSTHNNNGDSLTSQPAFSLAVNSIPGLGLLPATSSVDPKPVVSKPLTPRPTTQPTTQPTARPAAHVADHRERSVTPVVPDASTITTWPAALKHVTKHIATNEKAVAKIQHLISEQHKHERQWWTAREAIVNRQTGRAGNQAKVADLLKSLGGASVPVAAQDPIADQAELDAFDKKVYKGLNDMAADFDRQLRGLQVPFFAIKHELVILETGLQKEGSAKGRLDRGELKELQGRMIQTLEDLFGDE